MKFIQFKTLTLAGVLLTSISLSSCSKTSAIIINDVDTTEAVLNDNYRNFYEIFVASYQDSDGDHVGDLNGVTSKLDYIKDLGYNGIWLMPINVSPTYHKYDVADYYSIDSSYGTLQDLENLITECHERDIKIIMDLVINHSSTNNNMFKYACSAHLKEIKGETLTENELKYKDFYCFYNTKEEAPRGKQLFLDSTNTFYYEANFTSNMPEFNYDNPEVMKEIKNIAKFYLDKGIDGFRLDAVKYIYVENTNKTLEVLKEFNNYVKSINKDAYIVGECWSSNEEIANYYTTGIDSFFNFSTSGTGSISTSLGLDGLCCDSYERALNTNISMANGYIPAPFLDNHDMSRVGLTNVERTKFMYGLLTLMNGAAFTYYGDEIGMVGNVPPDENVRIAMLWDENYNCKSPSGASTVNYIHPSVKEQLIDNNSILNYYKKANLLRLHNPEIARGVIEFLKVDDEEIGYIVMSKTYKDKKTTFVINFSQTKEVQFNSNEYEIGNVYNYLLADMSKNIVNNNGVYTIPPYTIALFK